MTCLICDNAEAINALPSASDATLIDCVHCGKFSLTGTLVACLPKLLADRDAAAKLSHVLRKSHEAGQHLRLDSHTAEAVLKNPLPRPKEQADLLIQWLAVNSPGPGEQLQLDYTRHGAIVDAKSYAGFSMLVEHLLAIGLVGGHHQRYVSGESLALIALTFEGWDYYETLRPRRHDISQSVHGNEVWRFDPRPAAGACA